MQPQIKDLYQKFKESSGISTDSRTIKKNNIFDSKNAMSISPLNGTIDFINQNFSDYKFIFLSHRSVLIYQTTKKWLVHNDIWKTGSHFI